MAAPRRPSLSDQDRARAVQRARVGDESVAAIARGIGVAPSTLRRWIAAAVDAPPAGPVTNIAGDFAARDINITTNNNGDTVYVHVAAVDGAAIRTTARAHGVALDHYLKNLLADVDHIEIKGISAVNREAVRAPIESLYTPLRSRDPTAERAPARGRRRGGSEVDEAMERPEERRVLLPEFLHRHARLLLVGKPGAGKTTFLHLVACMLARDHVEPRAGELSTWREEHLGLPRDRPPLIPALVRLRDLLQDLRTRDPDARQPSDRGWILDHLAVLTRPADVDEADDHGRTERKQQWERWFTAGEALLLLDGLDEVADLELRRRVVAIIRSACERWSGARFIVSSRPLSIEAMTARPLCFHRADIDDFEEEEVERFVEQWSAALFTTAPSRGAANTRSLVGALAGRGDLRELARSPVMLTCLCVIHYNEGGELPHGRARVYDAIVRWLLRARAEQRRARGYRDGLAENALEHLALAMTRGDAERPGKVAAIDFGAAVGAIAEPIRRYFPGDPDPRRRAELFLRDECELSSVIEETSGNQLKFWHLTIQEFLAAWSLARSDEWWRAFEEHLDDPQWDAVIALAAGCLFANRGQGRVDRFIAGILERGEGRGLRAEAETLVHVGRVLETMRAYEYEEDPDLVARQKALAGRVMAIFTKEGAAEVPVRTRVGAAEVIGRWGDPRLAEGVDNFVDVAGTGGKMGRYLVTVVEYGRFVAAGGYREGRYWDEAGATWKDARGRREPWAWEEQQEHPSRPVVWVSWHEARAYCRWLGERRGERVRLPTAAEWERAAVRAEGEFPWGSDRKERDPRRPRLSDEHLAEHLANFKESIGVATPVGAYPAGEGPCGHLDLAGNVWEWCEDGPPSEHKEQRWLKGGCWYDEDRGALVAAFRHSYWSFGDFDFNGFRVVVAREPG